MREYHFYVYIMASKSRTLYIGFTSRLHFRVMEHQDGTFEGFSKDYQCHRLVYFERYQWAEAGIAREKQLKRWSRAKKFFLIDRDNPTWEDLSEDWGKPLDPLLNLLFSGCKKQVSPLRFASVEMTKLG